MDPVPDPLADRPSGPLADPLGADAVAMLDSGRVLRNALLPYKFGIDELLTKISILREEFTHLHDYNPIEHITHRVKTPESIVRKMVARDIPLSLEAMTGQIHDIAGIRITCSFISDIHRLHGMLDAQPDVTTIELEDYVERPKPNGYRSLHAILETPVHLSTGPVPVRVELQIRTIAMDFWASLEHKIYYKYDRAVPRSLRDELTAAATTAHHLDQQMESLRHRIQGPPVS